LGRNFFVTELGFEGGFKLGPFFGAAALDFCLEDFFFLLIGRFGVEAFLPMESFLEGFWYRLFSLPIIAWKN